MIGISLFASTVALSSLSQKLSKRTEANQRDDGNSLSPSLSLTAVNYHFTRKCNFKCGFCFHTAKTSHVESLDSAKAIILQLRQHGAQKINFAGGEPFLPEYKNMLGEMVKYAKQDCQYNSVSIISNGFYISRKFFEDYGSYLDILGVSCDSLEDQVNARIGRGKAGQADRVLAAAALCKEFNVKFKLNTVVNQFNKDENMSEFVRRVDPIRWKIFQVLPLEGENIGKGSKRDVTPFLISTREFNDYIDRHKGNEDISILMRVEDNSTMQSSYILVDEYGRFLDSSTGGKIPTRPILEVGVETALAELAASAGGGYDEHAFRERDGAYKVGSTWNRFSRQQQQEEQDGEGGQRCAVVADSCCSSSSGEYRDIEDLI
jgi:radical S-adenosyl methionine domain-containing protein 2